MSKQSLSKCSYDQELHSASHQYQGGHDVVTTSQQEGYADHTQGIDHAAGIAPYMALELGVFDLMPRDLPPFVRGFCSALMATSLCYPLDTVR